MQQFFNKRDDASETHDSLYKLALKGGEGKWVLLNWLNNILELHAEI